MAQSVSVSEMIPVYTSIAQTCSSLGRYKEACVYFEKLLQCDVSDPVQVIYLSLQLTFLVPRTSYLSADTARLPGQLPGSAPPCTPFMLYFIRKLLDLFLLQLET